MNKIVSALSVCLLAAVAVQGDVINASTADTQILSPGAGNQGSGTIIMQPSGVEMKAGRDSGSTGRNVAVVIPFLLPNLGAGQSFGTSSLSFNLISNEKSNQDYDVDLYGINARTTSTVLTSDFYFGWATDPDATKLQDNILTEISTTGSKTSTDITSWMNTQYAEGANAGKYVFLRLSATGGSEIYDLDSGFTIASANAASNKPVLNYTVIPEPGVLGLVVASGVGILFIRRTFMI